MRFRHPRFPSDIDLKVEHDGEVHHAHLVDVSITGARLRHLAGLPTDAGVMLYYLHLRFPARVVWSAGRLTGLSFLTPLSTGNLHLLRGVDGRRAGAWGTSHELIRELA